MGVGCEKKDGDGLGGGSILMRRGCRVVYIVLALGFKFNSLGIDLCPLPLFTEGYP